MRILITGANGFIAREILTLLSQAQHEIIACVRGEQTLLQALPGVTVIPVDFLKPPSEQQWLTILKNIDVVINCVGVFQTVKSTTMWQIHYHAPRTLFWAAQQAGVKKIIHISALGIDQSDTEYAKSKLAIEQELPALTIDSVIIRPSLVYGKDCYGGSALFRGLAGMPGAIFLPGQGEQLLQPIHIHDLAKIVTDALQLSGQHLICAVGAEKLSLKTILNKLRDWLGFNKAFNIPVPWSFLKIVARLGNLIPNAPVSTTGIKMLAIDNIATAAQEQQLANAVSFKPRSFTQGLASMTSGVQDRWHARLFMLRPLLQLSIAFIWIFTGVISLLTANTQGQALLNQAGIAISWQPLLLYSASIMDIALGAATLLNYRLMLAGTLQIILIFTYTIIITCTMPALWLHPFAPVAKNIPLIAAILIMMALSSKR